MNLPYRTRRFFVPFCFLFGLVLAQAQTDANCYDPSNAQTVGQPGWTGCDGMYIVKNRSELEMAVANGSYAITHTDSGTSYTFGDSDKNIFTGQVTICLVLFMKPVL